MTLGEWTGVILSIIILVGAIWDIAKKEAKIN